MFYAALRASFNGPQLHQKRGTDLICPPFFLSVRVLFLRVLVAARFDLWICEVENLLCYTFTGVLQL
jgi:hypothetical protein